MSPTWSSAGWMSPRFPRVSGDEPYVVERRVDESAFSPRERG